VKNVNKNNAVHAIVFEAVAVAIALEEPELMSMGVALLAKFLSVREPNLKYLALENMARLAEVPAVVDTGRGQLPDKSCQHWHVHGEAVGRVGAYLGCAQELVPGKCTLLFNATGSRVEGLISSAALCGLICQHIVVRSIS